MQTNSRHVALFGAALAAALSLVAAPSHAQDATATGETAQASGSYFTHAGRRIFYKVSGQGEPIVLIHGFPLSGELFQHQRSGLDARFKIVTLDLAGFGRSAAAPSPGSIAGYAKDVVALMDHLQIKKAIIGGHSMGGVITMELYREVPQRFAGMILIDTNPMPAGAVEKAEWSGYAAQARTMGIASTIPLLLPQMLTGETRVNDPAAANALKGIVSEASLPGFVGGTRALAQRDDYRPLVKTIAVPTLIVEGLDDALWPVEIDQMLHAAIPNSKLDVIKATAHASVFETPAEANTAIGDFAAGIGGPN